MNTYEILIRIKPFRLNNRHFHIEDMVNKKADESDFIYMKHIKNIQQV